MCLNADAIMDFLPAQTLLVVLAFLITGQVLVSPANSLFLMITVTGYMLGR